MSEQGVVMVVEDDETISMGLVNALEREGYTVTHHDNGEDAVNAVARSAPDLVLLDIMLPGIDGLEVLRRIKTHHAGVQIILLTAKDEELDRVLGLELGGDDYVTKPFSLRELMARVKARFRERASLAGKVPSPAAEVQLGEVRVDLRRRVVYRDGQEDRLTTHEAGVLSYLISNQGRNVTRDELLQEVWGYAPGTTTRTVDNQVLKLRKKIEIHPRDPRYILTIHGTGYRLEP